MTDRQKLTLNHPRKASQEEQPQSNSVYGKKVWVNTAPKKQAKNPHPPKVVKQQLKKPVVKPKQEVNDKCLPIARRRLRACLGSIGHHADYRALIQLGAFRYDKDGQKDGEVTKADVEDNLQRLARRNKSSHQPTDAHADLALGK